MLTTFRALEPVSQIELTAEEMLAISEEISLKFAPERALPSDASRRMPANPEAELDRPADAVEQRILGDFSYGELQAISRDISGRYLPEMSGSQPEILLLPVDPHHMYAYWHTAPERLASIPQGDNALPLTLRVFWRPEEPALSKLNLYFDVPLENPAHRKKIRLPIGATFYSAELGHLDSHRIFTPLAISNRIFVPARAAQTLPPSTALTATAENESSPFAMGFRPWLDAMGAGFVLSSNSAEDAFRFDADGRLDRPQATPELLAGLQRLFDAFHRNPAEIPLHSGEDKFHRHASGLGT